MRNKIYLYSDIPCQDFIKNLFLDFDILNLTDDLLSNSNFKNNNAIFIISEKINITTYQSFFTNNKAVVFYSKKERNLLEKNYDLIVFFYGPIEIKKFFDAVKICFFSKSVFFKDLKIINEKITNIKYNLSCSLTALEKKILIEFIERKKIKRDYFLEKIFKVKKDIETKTIESHLTRIRKKLLLIKSEIKISSKGNIFYFEG